MIEPSPELRAWIFSRTALDTETQAARLVSYLTRHPRFAPDRFGTHEPLKRLSPDRIGRAVELIVNRAGQELHPDRVLSMVFFERRRSPSCS